jgi:hypothetical protein
MPYTSNTRAKMIGSLVEHSVNTASSGSHQYWLKEVFEKGFSGYSKLSDRQLLLEMQLHVLIPTDDVFEDDAEEAVLHDEMFS